MAEEKGEAALKHAIAAAELYMQAAGKARTPEDRKRLRRKCADLIAFGERLKTAAESPPAASRPPVPESNRPLTTAEKTIVLKASRLHGNVFPPWESAPNPALFSDAGGSGGAYVYVKDVVSVTATLLANTLCASDPSPFSLSPEQQAIFAGWRRPAELAGEKAGVAEGDLGQLMAAQAEMDLAQDLATDCSVVASLCAAARHFGSTNGSVSTSSPTHAPLEMTDTCRDSYSHR